MKPARTRTTIDAAAQQFRALVRSVEPGESLGNEEGLIAQLGVSRATVRQVARLLEREGLLLVKRGIHGGYFAARPDLRTIENSVSSYLEMLDTDVHETTIIGSALWVEVLRKAAGIKSAEAAELLQPLRERVAALRPSNKFDEILKLEQELRTVIFGLINSRYIELIFQINLIFARRQFPTNPGDLDGSIYHQEFVLAWRNAKLIELDSLLCGDPESAALAARHSRKLWYERIWGEKAV